MDLTEHRNGIQDEQIKGLYRGQAEIKASIEALRADGCKGLASLTASVRSAWRVIEFIVIPAMLALSAALFYVAVEGRTQMPAKRADAGTAQARDLSNIAWRDIAE